MKFLRTIHSLPYCSPDKRAITRAGWDDKTQVYLHLDPEYTPNVPTHPTREQLQNALVTLAGPWSSYQWATGEDAAAMLSGILSAVFRPALSLCPGYMFDASTQGSGKSLAATALGCLMTGRRVGVTPFAGDGAAQDDEVRKKMLSHVIAGDPFICVDNVVGHWKSSALASVLTSGRIVDRVLGASKTVDAEALMLVTSTANNCSLDADLSRRLLRVRIESGANPTQKHFDFSPPDRSITERLNIAEAACTLLAGYWAAGAPRMAVSDAGGFGDWSALCRFPIMWAASEGLTDMLGWGTLGDPAASLMSDPSASDPEIENLGDLLVSLNALSEGQWFDSRAVQKWYGMGSEDRSNEGPCSLLYQAVRDLRGPRADEPSPKTLGRLLMYRRDRVCRGLRLTKGHEAKSGVYWRVEHHG